MKKLTELAEESKKSGAKYVVWFGHYTTSTIVSSGTGAKGLRGLIGKYPESYVYLCGHLHSQEGLVPKMYTLHKEGFFELEVADWKKRRW